MCGEPKGWGKWAAWGGGDWRLREWWGVGYFTCKSEYWVHALDINWGYELTHAVSGVDLWSQKGVIVEWVSSWDMKMNGGRVWLSKMKTEPRALSFGLGSTNQSGNAWCVCVGCWVHHKWGSGRWGLRMQAGCRFWPAEPKTKHHGLGFGLGLCKSKHNRCERCVVGAICHIWGGGHMWLCRDWGKL